MVMNKIEAIDSCYYRKMLVPVSRLYSKTEISTIHYYLLSDDSDNQLVNTGDVLFFLNLVKIVHKYNGDCLTMEFIRANRYTRKTNFIEFVFRFSKISDFNLFDQNWTHEIKESYNK